MCCATRETNTVRSPCPTTKSSPCSLQLEKACTQQQRPITAKNKLIFKKKENQGVISRIRGHQCWTGTDVCFLTEPLYVKYTCVCKVCGSGGYSGTESLPLPSPLGNRIHIPPNAGHQLPCSHAETKKLQRREGTLPRVTQQPAKQSSNLCLLT